VRYPLAVAGLFAGLIVASQAVAAPKGTAFRKVQLISMTRGLPTQEKTSAPDSPTSAALADASPPLDPFQVHDLSRRYVEFRMQQAMAAALVVQGGAPILTGESAGVAASSSIKVPRYGMMSAVACEHGIPTGLFDAMIMRESGYNPVATSTANAYGLAQLMPGTAVGLGVDRYDPLQNMRGGARYLRQQLDRFGQVHLALAAYNAGPGRIRGGLVPRIIETQAYVTDIISNWSRLTTTPRSPSVPAAIPPRRLRYVTYARY
jgi:soluble lytic murein transglycosylase-like protein